jgi:hypothetical protein
MLWDPCSLAGKDRNETSSFLFVVLFVCFLLLFFVLGLCSIVMLVLVIATAILCVIAESYCVVVSG